MACPGLEGRGVTSIRSENMSMNQRKFVAGFQTSLDGFIAGPDGEQDWVENWSAALSLIGEVDLFVLGGGMYPPYGDYWRNVYESSSEPAASEDELAYARKAAVTRHVVLSKTAQRVSWPNSEIVRSLDDLRAIKAEGGGTAYVVGGATTAVSLLEAGLLDELALFVHPVVLGTGLSFFETVTRRHQLALLDASVMESGHAALRYRVMAAEPAWG